MRLGGQSGLNGRINELLKRCRDGEPAALADFCATFHGVALRAAAMMNQYDADDIAQQTMELMLRVFATGGGPTDNPHGYVSTVARRLIIKSRPVNVVPLPADAMLIDAVDTDLASAILQSVATLPPLERRIAWAHWVLDRPLDEIAAIEGLPTANSAARHLQRAKPKLRKILKNLVM